ncbi:gamma-glutamyltranspeptidase 1, partial [Tanacetum coccineum]
MMHPGRLHRQMRKKLRCVKVEFTYPKTSELVTRGSMLDFGLRFCSTCRAKQISTVVERKWSLRRILLRKALIDYEAETVTTFKLRHCWEILKGSPKWMQSEVPKFAGKSGEGSKRYKTFGSNSFNIEFREASININVDVGDDEEDKAQEIRRPIGRDKAQDATKKKGSRASGSSSMNDEALARLMVFEM